MRCVMTEAHVRLSSHGEYLYGDVFLTSGGNLVMRVCNRSKEPLLRVKHFTIMSYDIWFEEIKTSDDTNSTLFAEGFIDHGYKGITL